MGEVGGLDTGVLDIAIACIVMCWAWEGKINPSLIISIFFKWRGADGQRRWRVYHDDGLLVDDGLLLLLLLLSQCSRMCLWRREHDTINKERVFSLFMFCLVSFHA